MKKFFGFLMAVAVLFTTSCAKEDISSSIVGNGETVEVTFTANLPELGTRAYGEAEQITTLRYFVFDAETETPINGLSSSKQVTEVDGKKTFTVRLALIKGVSYNMLFWADNYNENAESNHYAINPEDGVVTINYEEAVANDESRDAFFAVRKGFTASNVDTNVTLRRPFAQLNVYANDIEDAHTAGIKTIYSSLTTEVYTTLNPFASEDESNSALYNTETVEFTQTECPNSGTTGHLSMNYLLVPSKKTTINVSYVFKGKYEGNDTEVTLAEHSFTCIPIQRNYKTNIKGSLLTDNTNFNVTIEKDWDAVDVNKVFSASDLQAALENAEDGDIIYLGADIVGDVTAVQKQGVEVTIDGCNYKYNGTIKVHSNSNYYADAALTIKNVKFETSAAGVNVIEALENGAERYSSNITVEDCTFTATGEAVNTSVGVQIKASKNAKVIRCTATNMHSLIQAQSCDESVLVQGCTVNGKNGVAFKQVKAATVEGTTITALEYGIRFDGNTDNYGIVVKDNNVTAVQPLIVRKMTGKNNTIALEGTNTLTTEAEYQIVITNGSDDAEYIKPTGTYTLTGADAYSVFPAPFPVASWEEFTAALAAGEENIKLTADITHDANYQLQKSVTLNLGGYAMTLPMINIHTKTTIKNGTINGKVYARKNSEIVFNNVKFSGAVADNLSTEGHLAIQGGCKSLYAKDCLFSPTSVSGSQTKPLSFEGGSTIMKFENCEFKSSPYKKQVYFNSLSATGSLDFTNCNFNNKTPNIMLAAACPFTSLTMTGTTKLSSVTLEINRAKDVVTAEDLAYLRTLIANNSFSSVRVFYAGGSSEYIR